MPSIPAASSGVMWHGLVKVGHRKGIDRESEQITPPNKMAAAWRVQPLFSSYPYPIYS
jgi:hypothetical protein